jgi:hypothetical protein
MGLKVKCDNLGCGGLLNADMGLGQKEEIGEGCLRSD